MGAAAEKAPPEHAPAPALAGRLSAVSLFDLCQFLMLNRKTGTLTVRNGALTAYLTFSNGQLMTALDEALRDGEGVVLRAVQWLDGSFDFSPGPVPPDRRIEASTENILLEAARRIDEMRAGGADAEGEEHGAEKTFREKQERAESLGEMVRRAMALDDAANGAGWKEAAVRALREARGERLLLGPGANVHLLADGACYALSPGSAAEVRSWMDELAPPAGGGTARVSPQLTPMNEGGTIWAQRFRGMEGDWIAASLASPHFPLWSDLGFGDELYADVSDGSSGLLLILGECRSGGVRLATIACAAWLKRSGDHSPESGLIVDDFPRYEWSSLPGGWHCLTSRQAAKPGALVALVRACDAQTLVLVGRQPGSTLADALQLAASGMRVCILEPAADPDAWMRSAESRLALAGLPPRIPGSVPVAAWALWPGPPPTGLPLQGRLFRMSGPAGQRAA